MRKTPMIIAGFAVVGLAAVGGSAFTGTGVATNAGTSQYIGGTVSQSVTGATLSNVAYGFGDAPANTAVHSVVLTFADAAVVAKTPSIAFTGGNAVAFTCDAVAAGTFISTCTTAGADRVGVTSLAVTI
jgi:hypothetical protein